MILLHDKMKEDSEKVRHISALSFLGRIGIYGLMAWGAWKAEKAIIASHTNPQGQQVAPHVEEGRDEVDSTHGDKIAEDMRTAEGASIQN